MTIFTGAIANSWRWSFLVCF